MSKGISIVLLIFLLMCHVQVISAENKTFEEYKAGMLKLFTSERVLFINYWAYTISVPDEYTDRHYYEAYLFSGADTGTEEYERSDRLGLMLRCGEGDSSIQFAFHPMSDVPFEYEDGKTPLAWSHNKYPARSIRYYKSGTLGYWLEIGKKEQLYRKLIYNPYGPEIKLLKVAVGTELNGFIRAFFITKGVREVTDKLREDCGIT